MNVKSGVLHVVVATVIVCPTVTRAQATASAPVEDIIVARTWRESRIAPTTYCMRSSVGFSNIRAEARFAVRSVTTRASDGRVIDTNAGTLGDLHVCFGSTPDSTRDNFYAEGTLAGVTFVGRGECVTPKADFPEAGLSVSRCYLDLTDLPSAFVGGHLTTNTLNTRAVFGELSDPAGYTQTSITTVRLWRRR